MARYLYTIIWLMGGFLFLSAQDVASPLPPKGYIIQLDPEIDIERWNLPELRSQEGNFIIRKVIDAPLKILYLEHAFGESQPEHLQTLRQMPGVRYAELNYPVSTRGLPPNDPFWDAQWNLHRIGALSMWSESAYGQTIDGTPIAVAILEPEGFDVQHEDLVQQIWVNEKETPADQLDNDGNGYIDDYMGWNANRENDSHNFTIPHGTWVAGILSATNDNDLGIASVGWNTKLVLMSGNLYVSQVISNYIYVLRQRQLFNETNGQEGAFIVATNASFGYLGEVSEIWCDIYNRLGEAGILSVSAAPNEPINIDLRSDMPTSCSSEFLITVTGVDAFDNFLTNKAYGLNTVDIAAPASHLVTTHPMDQYIELEEAGNSMAAPHVSGAIGLMYSLPFNDLEEMAIQEPANTALLMKSFLFDGAKRLSSLSGKIKTGGRLDLTGTYRLMKAHFTSREENLTIRKVYPNPFKNYVLVDCYLPEVGPFTLKVYDMQGRLLASDKYDNVVEGQRLLRMDLHLLPSGLYQLQIEGASAVDVAKLVKF